MGSYVLLLRVFAGFTLEMVQPWTAFLYFFILHQLLLHTLTKSDQITINNLQYSLCPVTNIFLAQFCEFCALAAEPWWNWMRLWIPCLGALQLGCLVQVLLKDVSRLAGYDF